MIMQRIEFDGQDDPSAEPLMNSERPGFLYRFVPQNMRSLQLRIDNAQSKEILIQRKSAHDLLSEAFDQTARELYFG